MATTRVDVRFEPELWRAVEEFMRASRTETASDAVRMLVEIGASRLVTPALFNETVLSAMRRTCEREAAKKLRALVDKILGGASLDDDEIAKAARE